MFITCIPNSASGKQNYIALMDIQVYCKENPRIGLLPHPLRCLIVGTSGSGKTNLLLNFIYKKRCVPFTNLYICSRSMTQPAYIELKEHFANIEKELGDKVAHFYSNPEELVSLEECKPKSLVVFDDCLMENQQKIKDYFIRGRHKKVSCVYLSQSYGKVDMQVIRNNINVLCMFSQNGHYTKRVYDDVVGSDMTLDQFKNLCKTCWSEPHGFLTIDVTKKMHAGKYRMMLKEPLMAC